MADWTKEELEEKLDSIESAVTIPVNLRINGRQTILDLTEVERVLRGARMISIGECGCREKMHRCDAPLDVCFGLDKQAEELVEKGLAKKASLDEALDALKRSHEAGLVHVTYTFKGKEKPEVICSCCSCCCHSLSALVRFGMSDAVVASKFIAATDLETCINCGKCVTRCQFKARRLEEGKLVYDKGKCFGCGLCLSTCYDRFRFFDTANLKSAESSYSNKPKLTLPFQVEPFFSSSAWLLSLSSSPASACSSFSLLFFF